MKNMKRYFYVTAEAAVGTKQLKGGFNFVTIDGYLASSVVTKHVAENFKIKPSDILVTNIIEMTEEDSKTWTT